MLGIGLVVIVTGADWLVGSSTYNILVNLGLTCLAAPGGIPVGEQLVHIDIPVMLAVALACIPVFYSARQISRAEGIVFVSAYALYLGLLIALRT